jgi:hypothetical protein
MSGIDPISLRAGNVQHTVGKLSTRDTTFLQTSLQRRSARQVMHLQSHGNPNYGNFRTPIWSPETKNHLDVAPVESCRVYYKGEGGGFPQVQAVVSLVCPSCPWLILTPKVFQLCPNHFELVLFRSM